MCPDPALLVAYLDGTLVHRDQTAVEGHVQGCASCTALLAAMRRHRASEDRSKRRARAVVGATAGAGVVAVIGVWLALTSVRTPPAIPADEQHVEAGPEAGVSPNAAAPASVAGRATTAGSPSRSDAGNLAGSAPPGRHPVKPSTERASGAQVSPVPAERRPETPLAEAQIELGEGGLILRGANANRRFLWRVRDRAIERSTDGGLTWVVEHTAARAVRAGWFVNSEVAWLVGDGGLVLRRTRNGWFGTTPPADGAIVEVRASSPSLATVTLEDGRVFHTENGAVTWALR